jgi:AraC-like DNA-binding protein
MNFNIDFLKTILKVITLHTFFLSVLMSLGMILSNHKKVKNQIFFGLFLTFSLIIFYFFLYESNYVKTYPYLSTSCLSGVFLIGPMIYFLTQYSLDKSFKLTIKESYHLLPALLALFVALIGVKILGYSDRDIYYKFYGGSYLILVLGIFGSASFTIYLVLAGKKLAAKYLWNLHTLKNEPAALASMILFDIFSLAAITDTLAIITNNILFLQLSIFLISACVLILFILNLVYPNFEIAIGDVVFKEKQRRSYLSNIDSENLKDTINELLLTKEIYTDENLNLEKLASIANVSTHQLSEFINTHYDKNYSLFINEFRVNKAQQLLLKRHDFTILAIAYEVGFKSKSSFNDAFLKITGITPSQFKKNHT